MREKLWVTKNVTLTIQRTRAGFVYIATKIITTAIIPYRHVYPVCVCTEKLWITKKVTLSELFKEQELVFVCIARNGVGNCSGE